MEILLLPLVIGAIVAPALVIRRGDWLQRLALGAGFGIGAWGAIGFLHFLLLLPFGTPRTVGLASMGCALAGGAFVAGTLVRIRPPLAEHANRHGIARPLWLAISSGLLMTCGLEATLPHFGGALRYYDWWMHFDLARFYAAPSNLARTYGENATITSRTPLYNILGGIALAIFGDRFAVFEVLTAAIGWLFLLPLALIARRLLRYEAAPAVALVALSPVVLQSHTYTWPKGLATFAVLLAVDRFLALKSAPSPNRPGLLVQLGLASGLTVMAHAGFAGYLVPAYLWLLFDCWRRQLSWSWTMASCGVAVLVALPWYAWGIAQYGVRPALLGYPSSPYPGVVAWIVDHVMIVVTSLFPVALPSNLVAGRGDVLQQYLILYMGTAAGVFGLLFLVKSAAMNLYPRSRLRGPARILSVALGGILLVTILFEKPGWGWTGAGALFIPALILLLLLVVRRARPSRVLTWAGLGEVLAFEAVILLWMWSSASAHDPNAVLAVDTHVRFLGRDAWPVGVTLMAGGAFAAVAALAPWLRPAVADENRERVRGAAA